MRGSRRRVAPPGLGAEPQAVFPVPFTPRASSKPAEGARQGHGDSPARHGPAQRSCRLRSQPVLLAPSSEGEGTGSSRQHRVRVARWLGGPVARCCPLSPVPQPARGCPLPAPSRLRVRVTQRDGSQGCSGAASCPAASPGAPRHRVPPAPGP